MVSEALGSEPWLLRVTDYETEAEAIAAAIRDMVRFAREDMWAVRPTALQAVAPPICKPTDQLCYSWQLAHRMRRTLFYVPDPLGHDLVQAPMITLATGGGDCASLSALFAALALSIGLHAVYLFGRTDGRRAGLPSHVLPGFRLGGRVVPIEVSSKMIPLGEYPPGFALHRVLDLERS